MNLNQITLPSIDLEQSVVFYKKLGLHLIVDALPRYVRFECPKGDATLSLHLVDELPSGSGIIMYFELENLDEQVTILQQKDIAFKTTPKDQSWLWREASLVDPDGNNIILYHAGKNRKNPPWRVD